MEFRRYTYIDDTDKGSSIRYIQEFGCQDFFFNINMMKVYSNIKYLFTSK
jgi:hypothetical protein